MPAPAKTRCIRGDAFCVAVRDICKRMRNEVLRLEPQRKIGLAVSPRLHTHAAYRNAVLRIISDLDLAMKTNKDVARTYRVKAGKIIVSNIFVWYACDTDVEKLALPQKPDVRLRPGRQKSRRL